jgi:hypothetical protein
VWPRGVVLPTPITARRKFSRGYFYTAFRSCRVFNEADVNGCPGKQASHQATNSAIWQRAYVLSKAGAAKKNRKLRLSA